VYSLWLRVVPSGGSISVFLGVMDRVFPGGGMVREVGPSLQGPLGTKPSQGSIRGLEIVKAFIPDK